MWYVMQFYYSMMDGHQLLLSLVHSHLVEMGITLLVLYIMSELTHRTRHYQTRNSLLSLADSAWRRRFESRECGAYMQHMGVDPETFDHLLQRFCVYYTITNAPGVGNRTRGRPTEHTPADALGMALTYMNSRIPMKTLQSEFGIPQATQSRTLDFALSCLLRTLDGMDAIRISWPDADEIREYADVMSSRHETFDTGWGAIDGCRFEITAPRESVEQKRYYNHWQAGFCVTNLFVFVPDGRIVWANINNPGCMHDSRLFAYVIPSSCQHTQTANNATADCVVCRLCNVVDDVSSGLSGRLRTDMPTDYFLYGDSAFPHTKDCEGYVVTPTKDNEMPRGKIKQKQMKSRNYVISSARMLCEWGNGHLQKKFARLCELLPTDHADRLRLILLACYLNNLSAVRQAIPNQISTVYYSSAIKDMFRSSLDRAKSAYIYDALPSQLRSIRPRRLATRMATELGTYEDVDGSVRELNDPGIDSKE